MTVFLSFISPLADMKENAVNDCLIFNSTNNHDIINQTLEKEILKERTLFKIVWHCMFCSNMFLYTQKNQLN